MTITAKALLGFLFVTLLAQLWMLRLDVHASGPSTTVVLDRWTGKAVACINANGCVIAYPQNIRE